ncbi:Hypothetical predicted protein [Olea europaea subsp. europaea]|uniref:Uncharacterized protein n=1 Tax=Olea europaea subsp. europaea TaxID=158383 RepID=A0A8S0TE47_OLEEU|nr:Hypothetical predicted protein [Olea europaea subsp. europaea]
MIKYSSSTIIIGRFDWEKFESSNLNSGKVFSWNATSNYVKLQVRPGGFSAKPLVRKPWMKRRVKFQNFQAIMGSLMNDSCYSVNCVGFALFSVFP